MGRSGYHHLIMKSLTQQSLLKGKESVSSPKSSSKLGILVFHMHNPTVNRSEAPLRNIMIYTTLVTHFLAVLLLVSCNPCHDERHLHHQGGEPETDNTHAGGFMLYKVRDPDSHQSSERRNRRNHSTSGQINPKLPDSQEL